MEKYIEVLRLIEKNNYKAYVVGGYVRDKILGIPSQDIDICTNAKYDDLKDIFDIKDNGFMSYTINYNNDIYQITTFRKDKYKLSRKPIVKYVKSLKKDLKRRDFTINTLCIDLNDNIIDLYGAKGDIDKKVIRTVKRSTKSIKEDPLRILRAIRFSAYLDFNIDSKLDAAIRKYSNLLNTLSLYRIKTELTKIFELERGIEKLREYDIDKILNLKLEYKSNPYEIWSMNDYKKYPFSKQEKEELKKFI